MEKEELRKVNVADSPHRLIDNKEVRIARFHHWVNTEAGCTPQALVEYENGLTDVVKHDCIQFIDDTKVIKWRRLKGNKLPANAMAWLENNYGIKKIGILQEAYHNDIKPETATDWMIVLGENKDFTLYFGEKQTQKVLTKKALQATLVSLKNNNGIIVDPKIAKQQKSLTNQCKAS